MTRDSCSHSTILALLVLGAAAWIQAPLQAGTARSASRTGSAEGVRQEKPSAEELRAQAERDRLAKERLEQQRQRAEKARAESLRGRAAPGNPPGVGARPGATRPPVPGQGTSNKTIEERREIAQKAAHFESQYRSRVARVNRLIGIYKAKGDDAHVTQLERLREKLEVRREHAMEGFRKDLGDAGFQSVQSQVNGKGRRAIEERAKEKERVPPPKDKAPGDVGGGR